MRTPPNPVHTVPELDSWKGISDSLPSQRPHIDKRDPEASGTDDIPFANDDGSCILRPTRSLLRKEQTEDPEQKARLISQVHGLQKTFDDVKQRVDTVKEERMKLRFENQSLGQYIQN